MKMFHVKMKKKWKKMLFNKKNVSFSFENPEFTVYRL